jgi:hypothetical protein
MSSNERDGMGSRTVPGFLPSTSGFAFANSFPQVPVRRIGIPGVVSLGIGDASNGLCGGMAFAVRDYFEVDRAPPRRTSAPTKGRLFDYLVDRLFDSFDLPLGPIRYLQLMHPMLPDGETAWSRLGLAPHGRVWRTRMLEWPRIRADIDAGHPSPLGIVRVKSTDPFALKENHQVLAYGYEILGTSFTLRLYDPNLPNRDDVTLTLSWASPTPRPISWFPRGEPVHAFFRVRYTSSEPPEV